MYPPPSPRFLPALAQSHRLVTVVELHYPDGNVVTVPHTGGTVTVDRGAVVRRTATVTASDPALLPSTPADYLAVSGCRLRILRGLRHPDGAIETVPVFTGRLDSLEGDPDVGPITLTGSGLEQVVADDLFLTAYSTRTNTAAITSITALIQQSLPGAVVTSTAPDTPLGPRTWDAQADRWAAVQEIATAVGAEAFADADGVFRIEPLPDPLTTPPVWDIAAGEGGVLIEATGGWSRTGMYNVVVASGENSESGAAPVSATAQDDDPTSPTYVNGPFGRVPRFYSSPTITTVAQAQAAANALLAQSVRPSSAADITSLPNPCLEPGDIVRAVYGDGRRTLHQVQSYSLGLAPGDAFTLTMIGGKEDA